MSKLPALGTKARVLVEIERDGIDDAMDGIYNNPYFESDERAAYDNGYRIGSDDSIPDSDDMMAERRAFGLTALD